MRLWKFRQAAGEDRKALDRADDTTHLNGWVSRAMAAKHAHQDALLISPRVIVPTAGSKDVGRTPYPHRAPTQYVGIDHGRTDILVAQQFLHRPDVSPRFKQVRRKAVTKHVA